MYKLTKSNTSITRLSDGAFIPLAAGNRDYQEYLEWVALGNTAAPADPVVTPTPSVVSMRQARLAMLDAGILTSVSDVIAAMTGPTGEAARIEWEYTTVVDRDSTLVTTLSIGLGLDEAQLDSLFTLAGSL